MKNDHSAAGLLTPDEHRQVGGGGGADLGNGEQLTLNFAKIKHAAKRLSCVKHLKQLALAMHRPNDRPTCIAMEATMNMTNTVNNAASALRDLTPTEMTIIGGGAADHLLKLDGVRGEATAASGSEWRYVTVRR